jgi:galactose-1-phosphate uridylyltransferase
MANGNVLIAESGPGVASRSDRHSYVMPYRLRGPGGDADSAEARQNTIEVRVDPLFGLHTSVIALDSSKAIKSEHTETLKDGECQFCLPLLGYMTAEGKMIHGPDGYEVQPAGDDTGGHSEEIEFLKRMPGRIVSFPNSGSYMLMHRIAALGSHKTDARQLSYPDLEGIFASQAQLTEFYMEQARQHPELGINGAAIFMNVGPRSGASRNHLHYHAGALPYFLVDLADHEAHVLENMENHTGKDPVEAYLDGYIRGTERLIHEDDEQVIFVPFAPKANNQVEAWPKQRVANLTELTQKTLRNMARTQLGIYHAMADECNEPEFNVELMQPRFDAGNHGGRNGGEKTPYRLHWVFMGRSNALHGGLEQRMTYRIAVQPEETADMMRHHFARK